MTLKKPVFFIDGQTLASHILNQLKIEISNNSFNRAPGLCTIVIGNNPASCLYVRKKINYARYLGIYTEQYYLSNKISEGQLLQAIANINKNSKIDGILVQLPLPKSINAEKIFKNLNPLKDIDGVHPLNVGRLNYSDVGFIPCTAKAIIRVLESFNISLRGKNVLVIGRSHIVGKPVTCLLLKADCTVMISHSHTRDFSKFCNQAEILIAAAGVPDLVKNSIMPNCKIIDVGINRLPSGKVVGDVSQNSIFFLAKSISAVPGGVGPMTLAMLMENVWISYLLNGQV